MLGIKISSIWKFQPSLTPLADPCDIVIRGRLTVSGLGHASPGPRWETQEWTAALPYCLPSFQMFVWREMTCGITLHSEWHQATFQKRPWPSGEADQSSPSRGRHPHLVPGHSSPVQGQAGAHTTFASMTQTPTFLTREILLLMS